MMYAKLALRNVKRSAKDYLIYVITLILSVGLFYGFMSIASPYYNESLPVKINLEILNKAMRIAVPIVALLVIFLISYVNTYMLRRKQKEFAVQTIIGMEQRTVAFIFFMETMIMGAISIILGILLGIGLSQIVGYIVVQSFEVEWQPYLSLFPDTILFTLLFFGAIFIVMGIRNIRTVRQLKIIDMLHPLSKAATGQLYLLQAGDIDKTVKNAPLLAISVDSYNQMRALSDLPEITLDSDEYGIAWSFDTLPETITQFNQEVSSIHAGNSTLHKKAGADYQDPTGMVLFTSRMQAVYIVPDEICNNLLMATSFYAGNTEKPLAYDFAERFDQEMWKYQFGLGVFSENQLYVRLGTLQDNEGISNALLLRLVGTYAALVLIIICFTILSVQQLTDTIEQKKQFQTISKLGVEQTDCGRYIRQQMIFKFGLPVMVYAKSYAVQKILNV